MFHCYYYQSVFAACSQNKSGETPLHIAAKRGQIKLVKLLLDKGADIQIEVSWMLAI